MPRDPILIVANNSFYLKRAAQYIYKLKKLTKTFPVGRNAWRCHVESIPGGICKNHGSQQQRLVFSLSLYFCLSLSLSFSLCLCLCLSIRWGVCWNHIGADDKGVHRNWDLQKFQSLSFFSFNPSQHQKPMFQEGSQFAPLCPLRNSHFVSSDRSSYSDSVLL